MRKRVLSFALAAMMALFATACSQSEAAKAVDQKIEAIGEVSLDSEDAISAAEEALEGLSSEDKEQVKKTKKLEEARSSYEDLVKQDEAAKIDEAISAIGEVNAESGEKIQSAKALYDAASDEVKALVKGSADLEAAETKLDELQVTEVSDLIAAIGEVSEESKDKIEAAQAAYDKLTSEQQAKVENAAALSAASEQLKALKQAQAEALLKGMNKSEDKIRGMRFYYPSIWKVESDGTWYWGRSWMLPYIGQDDSSTWMQLCFLYDGDDWVFFKNVTIAADDQRFYKNFNYFDVTRDNAGGEVWETMDITASESDIEMLKAVANSKETTVRFEGDDYYYDLTVSATDKQAIAQVLEAYEALK